LKGRKCQESRLELYKGIIIPETNIKGS